MNPLFHTEFSISDSLKNVRKSILIYETIILRCYQRLTKNMRGGNKEDLFPPFLIWKQILK